MRLWWTEMDIEDDYGNTYTETIKKYTLEKYYKLLYCKFIVKNIIKYYKLIFKKIEKDFFKRIFDSLNVFKNCSYFIIL